MKLRTFMVTWLALLSFYRRHPLQALFLGVGLVTGVALWSAVQLINDHARASYAEADQVLGTEARYWVRNPAGLGIEPSDYIELRRQGFKTIYPVIELRRQSESGQLVTIIATDLLALGNSQSSSQASNPFAASAWLPFIQPDYEAWYSRTLAQHLGISEGESLVLSTGQRLPPAQLQTRDQQGERIFMDAGAALNVLELEHFSYLGVGKIKNEQIKRLTEALPTGLVLIKNEQALDLRQLTESLHTNLTALGFLSFVVGMFIVFNAVRFSLLSRRSTVATLRELGVDMSQIAAAIIAESVLISILGAGFGLILGTWVGAEMLPAVAASLQNLYGANLSGEIESSLHLFPAAIALTLIGVGLALALPLYQSATQLVIDERRQAFELEPLRVAIKISALIGGGLLLLAVFSFTLVGSVEAGFVVIGLVMFGGALMLPILIVSFIDLAARAAPEQSYLLRWSVKDALLQLPHLRIALVALLLTLVANIGVTLLVGSFRVALSDWLEVRLSANIFVAGDLKEGMINLEWVDDIHTRYAKDMRFAGRPATVFGVTPSAPDFFDLPLLKSTPDALERWRAGEANAGSMPILANEQLHYLAGVRHGEVISLNSKQFQVVGFVHDYGNPEFSFWLPEEVLRTYFGRLRTLGTSLWINSEIEVAREGLRSLGLKPGDWLEQDGVKKISFQIFDRTFAITSALNTLTLLVAAIALLSALMAVHQSRLVDYGHWRAIGVRWEEWFCILGLPLLLMVLCTLLLAIPLGYVLSWLLIHQLNVIAFGWTMPLVWSWQPVIELAALTTIIVLATLTVALVRTRRNVNQAVRQMSGASA